MQVVVQLTPLWPGAGNQPDTYLQFIHSEAFTCRFPSKTARLLHYDFHKCKRSEGSLESGEWDVIQPQANYEISLANNNF